jgi:hypothetical protein
MFLEIWANQIPILWSGSMAQNSERSIKNLKTTKVGEFVTVHLLSFADSSPTLRQFALFSEDGAFSTGGDRPRNPVSFDTSPSSCANRFIPCHFHFSQTAFTTD